MALPHLKSTKQNKPRGVDYHREGWKLSHTAFSGGKLSLIVFSGVKYEC
jgi:hypothetical protein